MFVSPFRDWLAEQERRRRPDIFLIEWLLVFALALLFWAVLFLAIGTTVWSVVAAVAVSSLYASGFVYVRLLEQDTCGRCGSPLALTQQVIGRRYLHEVEKCLEIERGGEEWYGHFIDLYARRFRVEVVKYRCRRCGSVWEKVTLEPLCDFELVRTIPIKD
jgi:hypothetical protein